MEDTSELRYKNHVRITPGSCVGFTPGNSVIKPCKRQQKTRNQYVMAYEIKMSL